MTLWERIWLWLSGGFNAFGGFGGDPGESFSARCWRERAHPEWERRRSRIDRFLGINHCKDVHEEQRKREDARRAG